MKLDRKFRIKFNNSFCQDVNREEGVGFQKKATFPKKEKKLWKHVHNYYKKQGN